MKKIHTDQAPAAIGPYSQAIRVGEWLFTSGQIPLDPATGEIHGDTIQEQAETVLTNLKAVLEAAGSTTDHIVKTTVFLADMQDFAAFNEVYGQHIKNNPARSCVAVRELPRNVRCEIEAIALIAQK